MSPGFPKSLPKSLPEFQRMFPSDRACAEYLEALRWSNGFACPHCGVADEPYRFEARPGVLRCRTCRRDVALTAGTVMERTHTPLSTWFWASYLVSSLTPGISATQFQRQLGLSRYETAFQILHKLRAGMVDPDRDLIGGKYEVELDETYVGGSTKGEGRGVTHQILVAGAVEIRHSGDAKPRGAGAHAPQRGETWAGRLRLAIVPSRKQTALEKFVKGAIAPKTQITTDGWQGYENLAALGYKHIAIVMKDDHEKADAWLPMIHIVFSNLKTWLLGTHHGVSPQHLQSYLDEYVFRFNRRFYPFNAFNSVLGIGVQDRSLTYDQLYAKGGKTK